MKQTELRLGNYITVHGCLQEIVELPLPENCTEENTNPIPLTEEWLFKFGFEYYPSKRENRAFRKGKLQIVLSGNYIYPNGRTYYKSWCIIESQPKTVHQLQNLYFALTGEELTLNK